MNKYFFVNFRIGSLELRVLEGKATREVRNETN